MANPDHLKTLRQGVDAWNAWRERKPDITPDLSGACLSRAAVLNGARLRWVADLSRAANLAGANLSKVRLNEADLSGADLTHGDLSHADLHKANLRAATLHGANLRRAFLKEADLTAATLDGTELYGADLTGANLSAAYLSETNLSWADLTGADLSEASLDGANLSEANLHGANIRKAFLKEADLTAAYVSNASLIGADLTGADLSGANLSEANLSRANLAGANLSEANLSGASLVDADITNADLTGCRIYGVSAWGLKLSDETSQRNLIITRTGEPEITVDNIEVAQFVYLLLHNEKIRDVIDTVGKKGVLLLGRFTEGRIAVLERLRAELRERGYLPIVFNFDKPETKDFTETVRLLAGLSHFVIADVTNPKSAPLELQATVPEIMVPFLPIIEEGEKPFSMLGDLWIKHRDWVFEPLHYSSLDALVGALDQEIIGPAEVRFDELVIRKAETMRGKHV
jgi:uncharacterized protein YjbI with pentapeptide repeats